MAIAGFSICLKQFVLEDCTLGGQIDAPSRQTEAARPLQLVPPVSDA